MAETVEVNQGGEMVGGASAAQASPSISIVIAWVNSIDWLLPGLEALSGQIDRRVDEVIVATRHDGTLQSRLHAAFPHIRILAGERTASIPSLRAMALRAAHGEVVAVTEDHCVPSDGWIQAIRRTMQDHSCHGVGGPVENAWTGRLRDQAAFLTEYAGAIRPADGDMQGFQPPGNNVAYRRSLIDELTKTLDRGLWESFYHSELEKRGAGLQVEPTMVMLHQRPFGFWYFISQRYHFSRSYAAMRNQSLSLSGRAKYALGSLALPALLVLRGFSTLVRKQRYVGIYLVSLPLILIYVTAGATGEFVGYLLGGGYSLEKIE